MSSFELTTVPVLAVLFVVFNVVTWAIYRWDKRLARVGKRRISERTLLAMAWLGGWLGALVAVYGHRQRHKARKVGFVALLWLGVITWIGGVVVLVRYLT